MAKPYNSLSRYISFLKVEQWLSVIAFAVNALVSVFVAVEYGIKPVSFVVLVIGTTVSVILDRINRHIFENKTMKQLDKIRHSVNDLECIGGIKEGIEWYIRHLDGLKSAYNTVFTRSDEEYPSVGLSRLDDYLDSIRNSLQSGCQWSDIYDSREKLGIDGFRSSLNMEQRSRYRSYEVSASLPMLQYTILRYRDDRQSVIFGWGFQGGEDDKAKVFVSHSTSTVEFFSNHFQAMRRNCKVDPKLDAAASSI